jgi:hypothetical protein
MKRLIGPLSLLTCAVLATGCLGGGKSSSSSSSSGSTIAQFIDAPVKGVKVKRLSSGIEVKTDSEGQFECEAGEALSFHIASIELGQAACGSEIFVTDFGEGRWQKAAKVLQCLSSTEPSSGLLDVSDVTADLSSVNLESDDDNSINTKLGSHKRRERSSSEAEEHAVGHLLDRVRYDPAFVALFSSVSSISKTVTASRVEVEGTGTDRCPKFYNVVINFAKNTKTISGEVKSYFSANLGSVAGYNADVAGIGTTCSELGISSENCKDWTAPELMERPTIHRDEFKIVKYKASFPPESGIESGFKKLKVEGEINVSGSDFTIDGEWKEEFSLKISGQTIAGECKYEF